MENAYQAEMCACREDMQQFKNLSPATANRLGRCVRMRLDFDRVKLYIMEYLLRQKFASGSDLAAKLIATGKEELIEGNTWNDYFWGVCRGQGQNHLGRILMQLRKELQCFG